MSRPTITPWSPMSSGRILSSNPPTSKRRIPPLGDQTNRCWRCRREAPRQVSLHWSVPIECAKLAERDATPRRRRTNATTRAPPRAPCGSFTRNSAATGRSRGLARTRRSSVRRGGARAPADVCRVRVCGASLRVRGNFAARAQRAQPYGNRLRHRRRACRMRSRDDSIPEVPDATRPTLTSRPRRTSSE